MCTLLTTRYVATITLSMVLTGISPLPSFSFVVGPGLGTRPVSFRECHTEDIKRCGSRLGPVSIQYQTAITASSTSCEVLSYSRPRSTNANSNSRHGRQRRHSSHDGFQGNLSSTASRGSPLLVKSTDIIEAPPPPPENAIPPIDPKTQSKLEQEFYAMMRQFASFTPRDIESVTNYRYRALFEGVVSGATEPQVIKAFAVVFEDLLPVRVAGRIIFKRLAQVMEASIEKRISVDDTLQNVAGFTTDEIDGGRRAFMILDVDGEGELTIDQLIESGIVETVAELLEYKSFDDFVEKLKKDEKGKLDFERFMVGLQRCTNDGCNYNCNLNEVFAEIAKMMEPIEEQKNKFTVSERKKKASAKYDSMVVAFGEWEDLVPEGDGRMIEVLRGCFAGAKNEKVLNALKIVYTDYSAIRIAGDLVFKLMRRLVGSKK